MPFDPLSYALPSLIGQRQLGQAAPPFQPGMGPRVGSGLLGAINQQATRPILRPSDAVSQLDIGEVGDEPKAPVGLLSGPQSDSPASLSDLAAENNFGQDFQPDYQNKGFFDKFFGNLDQNLQSPSKMIGLGLLNRFGGPPAAIGGLLAGGLFGDNKIFGGR